MPRYNRHEDEVISRESDYGMSPERRHGGFERPRDAFYEERPSGRIGGWGSLLEDESSGGRGWRGDFRPDDRSERDYGPDDRRTGLARDETDRLIASNKVEGTPVYDRFGDRLGSIHNFMVDKVRGHVVYAVLRHGGGFLGLDERYYPLDWDQLTYDTRLGGYHIDMTEEELKRRGSWDRNERWQGRREQMREPGRPGRGRFERGFGRNRELELHHERERFDTRPDYARGSMEEPW